MNGAFCIGDWEVQRRLNRIVRGDTTAQLEPKVMAVLLRLADTPGEVVDRDTLLDSVWNGTFVTEDTLTRSIKELRKALGDTPREPRYIETIRKVGYRLIAPVTPATPVDTPTTVPMAPGSSPPSVHAKPTSISSQRPLFAGAALLAALVLVSLWALLGDGRSWLSSELVADQPPALGRVNVPLTSFPGNEDDPAVSPDGTQVAFAWDGERHDNRDVYVSAIDGGAPRRLTTHPDNDHHPVWSPDASRIAFIRESGSACEIFVVDATGGVESPLSECGTGDDDYAWSPDGQWLARSYHDAVRAMTGLELFNLETGERRVLTEPGSRQVDYNPKFSADGQRISFIRRRGPGVEDIYVVPTAGGRLTRVTRDNRGLVGQDWAPGGQYLVFSSNRGGGYGLWRVAADGGEPEWLAGGGWKLKHPSVARDRDVVAYENWLYDVNLWQLVPGAAGDPLRIVASTQWDYEGQFSPDGNRIAFVSTRSGSYEIWLVQADGSGATQLTRMQGPPLGALSWSPDGARLAFHAWVDGQADLHLVDVLGGSTTLLTTGHKDEVAPSWSRDGRWVYFGSRKSGDWQVWRIPATGGTPEQVTARGGMVAREAASGALLYVKANEPGIWIRHPGDTAEEILQPQIAPGDWENWTVLGEQLYYIDKGGAEPRLMVQPLDEEPREVLVLPGFADRGFALDAEGARVLYARVDRAEADVMLLQNLQ